MGDNNDVLFVQYHNQQVKSITDYIKGVHLIVNIIAIVKNFIFRLMASS